MLGRSSEIDLELKSHAVVPSAEPNTWIDFPDVKFPLPDFLLLTVVCNSMSIFLRESLLPKKKKKEDLPKVSLFPFRVQKLSPVFKFKKTPATSAVSNRAVFPESETTKAEL
jgi:hypothetical protein